MKTVLLIAASLFIAISFNGCTGEKQDHSQNREESAKAGNDR